MHEKQIKPIKKAATPLCGGLGAAPPLRDGNCESNFLAKYKERIIFAKYGNLRFIGHLDFLRVFQQTIRRANLPVAYSQGFNPHILISFALPLPLGMSSNFDYVDITLNEECPNMVELLNNKAPEGLKIHKSSPVTDKGAASVVTVADYRVKIQKDIDVSEKINKLMESKEIITTKKTKSGLKNVDIRPDIISISEKNSLIQMRLYAGSARFLNPLTVMGQLLEEPSTVKIERYNMYKPDENGELVEL